MKKFLKRFVVQNFRSKIAALVMACLTWYFVQGEEVLEINRRLNVFINGPKGLMVRDGIQRSKFITLRGPRSAISSVKDLTSINAEVNLPNVTKGKLRYQLTRTNIKYDFGNRISIRIIDPVIELEFDERHEVVLPVSENLQGTPADGFHIEKITVSPLNVRVSGIKSVLSKLESISLEPKDITGISETKVIEANILPPPGVDLENISADSAQIRIQVGEKRLNKKFRNIPIEVVGSLYRADTTPPTVDIEIQGAPSVMTAVKPTDLSAVVDASNLQPGRHDKKIQVKIPNETTLIETNPSNVVLNLRSTSSKAPVRSTTTTAAPTGPEQGNKK